jgi:hypothetical protein
MQQTKIIKTFSATKMLRGLVFSIAVLAIVASDGNNYTCVVSEEKVFRFAPPPPTFKLRYAITTHSLGQLIFLYAPYDRALRAIND